MRKLICLILSTLFVFCLFGCSLGLKNENEKVISDVKEMEKNEHKLLTFEITYDKYKKATDKMLADYYKNKEDQIIFVDEGKVYKGKDLAGVSQEKMTELKKKLEKSTGIVLEDIKEDRVEISQVYDDDTFNYKHIFVKETQKLGEFQEVVIYKKYWFKKIDDAWKIGNINQLCFSIGKLPKEEKDKYEKYDGKDIKYVENLDFQK